MTGYLPLGFEIAAEMTYPENEGLTSGILNLSAQLFGILFTYIGTLLLDNFGPLTCNLTFFGSLIIGMILTVVMKIEFRRQKAHLMKNESEVESDSDTTRCK